MAGEAHLDSSVTSKDRFLTSAAMLFSAAVLASFLGGFAIIALGWSDRSGSRALGTFNACLGEWFGLGVLAFPITLVGLIIFGIPVRLLLRLFGIANAATITVGGFAAGLLYLSCLSLVLTGNMPATLSFMPIVTFSVVYAMPAMMIWWSLEHWTLKPRQGSGNAPAR